jgi:hypothetical protein
LLAGFAATRRFSGDESSLSALPMAYSLRRRDAQRGSIVLAAWQTTRGDVRETTDATGDTGDGDCWMPGCGLTKQKTG